MTQRIDSGRLGHDEIETPLGRLVLVADERGGLLLVAWREQHEKLGRELAEHVSRSTRVSNPHGASEALRAYFDGDLAAIERLSDRAAGSEFQRKVWRALRTIPRGQTLSYAEVARRIGQPSAVRAVGLANGSNPVSIVVPCHRVIGANGTLTGYGGGLERKRWLLAHEGALPQRERPLSEQRVS
jgi:methylated-DNA-[protein]-cysteine S-methyltransferase